MAGTAVATTTHSKDGKLTRREGEAIIARRLQTLGHEPDYLEPAAAGLLITRAAGSGRRLRAALASVLFLASTEDVPVIDADLVERALLNQRTETQYSEPMGPPLPQRTNWLIPGTFGIVVTAALLGVTVLALHRQGSHPLQSATTVIAQEQLSTPKKTARKLSPPKPAHIEAPAPAFQPLTSEAPKPASPASPAPLPSVAVGVPPVPPDSGATPLSGRQAQLALPTGVTPSVLLLFPAYGTHALSRLKPLALALQTAGIADIRARPSNTPPTRRVVSFFYSDDAALAQSVAKTLADAHWPRLDAQALQPSLVLLPPGLPARNPGEIEVQLP